jgi:hypothetical protein
MWLHSLTLNDPPGPADLIFVLAGRMDRKRCGLDLYRAGEAPRLLLSVGRFEVSRMAAIGFAGADDLIALRNSLSPGRRHFFCEMNARGLRLEHPELCRWNTYGEILGLRAYLEQSMPRTMLVVSSDVHLPRVALTLDKVFRGVPLDVRYCAVATHDRRYALMEAIKRIAYRVILGLPEGLIARLIRVTK